MTLTDWTELPPALGTEVSHDCADHAKDLTRGAELWSVSEAMQVINTPAMCKHHADNHIRYLPLDTSASEEEAGAAGGAVFNYILELLALKEREPGDDLITRLAAHIANGDLSRQTAAMTGFIMLQAGHETTASMIALGTLALLEHPGDLERLRQTDDADLIANVVDELMRYLTTVHSLVDRIALEDLTIGGQTVRAGDILLMNLPAGNWDPAFVENPGTFDIDRNTRGHLAFGYGVHQCIGMNLARAELQIALSTLARRMPGLRLAVPPEQLKFSDEQSIYGVRELPVTW